MVEKKLQRQCFWHEASLWCHRRNSCLVPKIEGENCLGQKLVFFREFHSKLLCKMFDPACEFSDLRPFRPEKYYLSTYESSQFRFKWRIFTGLSIKVPEILWAWYWYRIFDIEMVETVKSGKKFVFEHIKIWNMETNCYLIITLIKVYIIKMVFIKFALYLS